jgi:hypothetical protein
VPIDAIRPGENLAEELYALDMSSAELVRKTVINSAAIAEKCLLHIIQGK